MRLLQREESIDGLSLDDSHTNNSASAATTQTFEKPNIGTARKEFNPLKGLVSYLEEYRSGKKNPTSTPLN
jgi:hypothetical protein